MNVSTIVLSLSFILTTSVCTSSDEGDSPDLAPDASLTTADAMRTIDATTLPPNAKRVFVTRTTYTGVLGGLNAADAHCQNAATAVSLGGDWKAWLSNFENPAIDRITGTGPWYNLEDELVFANRAALATSPLIGIDIQENGEQLVIGDRVWTGTRAGGAIHSDTCNGWFSSGQGVFGLTAATDGRWTESDSMGCSSNQARLYCFEN